MYSKDAAINRQDSSISRAIESFESSRLLHRALFFFNRVANASNAVTRCGALRWSLLSWTREPRWDPFLPTVVVLPWLLRSSVHGAREDGITRGCESIERRTGESRRELDIARSALPPGSTLTCRRCHAVRDATPDARNVPRANRCSAGSTRLKNFWGEETSRFSATNAGCPPRGSILTIIWLLLGKRIIFDDNCFRVSL